MVALSDSNRTVLSAMIQSDLSSIREQLVGLTKADIRAAINAADAWADSNAASFNVAIPQPARNNLTAKQKAQLLMYVVRKRYEVA